MNFEEEWGKLDAENSVKRQLWTKYIWQTLVLMWFNAIRDIFDFFSASNKKCFDWRGKLDTNLKCYEA